MRKLALSLSLLAALLVSWQRQDSQPPKKKSAAYKKEEPQAPQKTYTKKEESLFASQLNSANRAKFYKMPADQKQKVMNLADNNQLSPDSAVTQISR